jgi:predicted oxidoreductase (fatty acid repression mutant protein)
MEAEETAQRKNLKKRRKIENLKEAYKETLDELKKELLSESVKQTEQSVTSQQLSHYIDILMREIEEEERNIARARKNFMYLKEICKEKLH